MYVSHERVFPIAIIARPKLILWGEHWGVQLPNGSVLHLTDTGVQLVTYDRFRAGRGTRVIRRARPGRERAILMRVEEALRNPIEYRLFDQNCEVFANRILGEKEESPQVQGTLLLVGLGLFLKYAG